MKKNVLWVGAGLAGVTLLATVAWWMASVGAVRADVPAADVCGNQEGLPSGWGADPRAGMVRIEGGEFEPGNRLGHPEERPNGSVRLPSFWIDRTEVTNAQFAAFVAATSYVTDAEREGGAVTFEAPAAGPIAPNSWWRYTPGTDWRHPEGPGSTIKGRDNHPVVQVTYADARAYANWLGRVLPTEAQWEFAARAGTPGAPLDQKPLDAAGAPAGNFWQGNFPLANTTDDGHYGRAPVGCFAANDYGLHDMIGNVWEWTVDKYTAQPQPHGTGDPFAARRVALVQGGMPEPVMLVIKGGSFLCAQNYCARYRSTSRHPQEADLPVAHVGFRTVAPAQ